MVSMVTDFCYILFWSFYFFHQATDNLPEMGNSDNLKKNYKELSIIPNHSMLVKLIPVAKFAKVS